MKLTEKEFNKIWHVCSGTAYPDALNFMRDNGYFEKSKFEEFEECYKSIYIKNCSIVKTSDVNDLYNAALAAIEEARESKE